MANFISEEFGKADFVLLEDLSTAAFMDNLKLRYQKGKIYSYIGEVVISVNPYRNLVIYDKEYVDVSGAEGGREGGRIHQPGRDAQGLEGGYHCHGLEVCPMGVEGRSCWVHSIS